MAFTSGTATFTNGSEIVTNVSLLTGDTGFFAPGTRVVVGVNPVMAEVEAIAVPSTGSIELRVPWNLPSGTYTFLANMTSEGLREAVLAIRHISAEFSAVTRLYDTVEDGLFNTSNGDYFNVVGTNGVFATLYQNVDGSEVFISEMLTAQAIIALEASAEASANAAASSESNAASSASNALASKNAAAASAINAANSASAAATSESNAASSANAAQSAQSATEQLFDQFGDQYLGSKTSDPTVDNDGDPLTEGDIYWNSVDNLLKFYTGTAWVAPESIATTAASEAAASASAAATSESNAASSALNAATSETNAASSASSALASKNAAATSESNAATSASDAANSASASATSASNSASSASDAFTSETNAASSASSALASKNAAATSATNAAASATNAADSEDAAATSASNAASSASSASSSASSANNSAQAAATSATNASNSASQAATSATNASNSASQASTSASSAATSATNASNSEDKAQKWAEENEDVPVETGSYSAKHYAAKAFDSAAGAAVSETNAETSETNAASSASSALASKNAAATSATNASNSASAAATSESNAAASETNAANSASNALASKNAAAISATNASNSASSASSSASSASTSASNASSSASDAATSATNAFNSAASASSSASNALASENAAASYAATAESAKDQTLALFDSFDDRYLGQKSADPALDNDGNALVAGALYFNTSNDEMKVYTGTQWVAAYASLQGALLANNNLSDLGNVVTARSNLGLGTAALLDVGTVSGEVAQYTSAGLSGFGYGALSAPLCSDLNSYSIPAGFYSITAATTNIGSRPSGAEPYGSLIVYRYANVNRASQAYHDTTNRVWVRQANSDNTGWGTWRELYTNGNLNPVTLDTSQTITGNKNFTGDITISNTGPATLTINADTDNVNESDVVTLLLTQDGGAVSTALGIDANNVTYLSSNTLGIDLRPSNGVANVNGNEIYHEGHKPTLSELGAAAASHTHSWSSITSVPLSLIMYNHGSANTGGDPYYIRLGRLEDAAKGYVEYWAKDDQNFPFGVSGGFFFSAWTGSTVSIQHQTYTMDEFGVRIYVDNNSDIWIFFPSLAWSTNWGYTIKNGTGLTLAGYQGTKSLTAPANSYPVYSGEARRFSRGNVTGGGTSYIKNQRFSQILAMGNVVAYYSDERLKKRVRNIDNALDKICSLSGFLYEENDLAKSFGFDNKGLQLALSAQEVQKVQPEAVELAPFDRVTDPTGVEMSKSGKNYLTVKYEKLIPLIVEALKEERSLRHNLEATVEKLSTKVAALTKYNSGTERGIDDGSS